MEQVTLLHGDALEVLRTLPDNSVDAIVTDPPGGISFMGREWDSDKGGRDNWIAAFAEIARECLRVVKPGAHALVWAIPRTSHWTATAWENGGWEVRDRVSHVFGSGFPKSHDVSKAIDKVNGEVGRLFKFTAFMRTTGLTARQINDATGTFMGSHYLTDKSQPAIPTAELWAKLRPLCGDVPAWVDELVERIEAEREVIGQDTKARSTSGASALPTVGGETVYQSWNITAPATDDAKRWQGWGSALKPAMEDWWLLRKPLTGTIAQNVMQWGTGALNIDACRVEGESWGSRPAIKLTSKGKKGGGFGQTSWETIPDQRNEDKGLGRWPAHLIHDGSDEVVAMFPQTTSGMRQPNGGKIYGGNALKSTRTEDTTVRGFNDTGSAARFYYVAKASKRDRDEGLEGFEARKAGIGDERPSGSSWERRDAERNPNLPRRNHHPTVKPTELMRYLCRLITPAGGVVLDPFAGSGSTGKGAVLEGFSFIGIEREADYIDIARARIAWAQRQQPALIGDE